MRVSSWQSGWQVHPGRKEATAALPLGEGHRGDWDPWWGEASQGLRGHGVMGAPRSGVFGGLWRKHNIAWG